MYNVSLTAMQRKIAQFIDQSVARDGAPPTLRDICKQFNFRSIGTAQSHIAALVRKGVLIKSVGKARGLQLNHRVGVNSIPVVGRVVAGIPLESIEHHRGRLPIPHHWLGRVDLFALEVMGDSMSHAGILQGDWIIARVQDHAQDRDIVVALVEGEMTVKRYRVLTSGASLMPENPAYSAISIQSEDVRIQGVVIGVHRYYDGSELSWLKDS